MGVYPALSDQKWKESLVMYNIFWLIGAVVVVLAILSLLGLS